jgi:hypothetical protein
LIPPEEGFAPSASRRSLIFTRREHTMSFGLGERAPAQGRERGGRPLARHSAVQLSAREQFANQERTTNGDPSP